MFFLSILLFLGVGTYFLTQIAKGYRFTLQRGFQASGLLVATSFPDGGQVWVDGILKSATNTTVFLPPGQYNVEVKKDGYTSWQKTLNIEKEVVAKTDAWLFPIVPNLQSLTFMGASSPLLSPDGTKIVYQVSGTTSITKTDRNGLWVIDFSDFPFDVSRGPRQIASNFPKHDFSKAYYSWSPDSRQILVTFPAQSLQPTPAPANKTTKKTAVTTSLDEHFILDTSRYTTALELMEMAQTPPVTFIIKDQWQKEKQLKEDAQLAKLPEKLVDLLKENAGNIFFSPDETKILYTATSSASLPDKLIPAIPGSSTQPQQRSLKVNHNYIYDIKEDRNFEVSGTEECQMGSNVNLLRAAQNENPKCFLSWFPSSRHLMRVEKDKVQIGEYENTNWLAVYSGPYIYPFVYAVPAANRLIILTNLSNQPTSLPNLYGVGLR